MHLIPTYECAEQASGSQSIAPVRLRVLGDREKSRNLRRRRQGPFGSVGRIGGTDQLRVGCVLLLDPLARLSCDGCDELRVFRDRGELLEVVRGEMETIRVNSRFESCEAKGVSCSLDLGPQKVSALDGSASRMTKSWVMAVTSFWTVGRSKWDARRSASRYRGPYRQSRMARFWTIFVCKTSKAAEARRLSVSCRSEASE